MTSENSALEVAGFCVFTKKKIKHMHIQYGRQQQPSQTANSYKDSHKTIGIKSQTKSHTNTNSKQKFKGRFHLSISSHD